MCSYNLIVFEHHAPQLTGSGSVESPPPLRSPAPLPSPSLLTLALSVLLQVSFHHGRCLHYSRGNSTSTPRCGLSTHLWPSPNEISDPKAAEELEALLTERVATRRKWSERHL